MDRYIYGEYPTYIRLHIIIGMKLKSMKDFIAADACNRYEYLSALA